MMRVIGMIVRMRVVGMIVRMRVVVMPIGFVRMFARPVLSVPMMVVMAVGTTVMTAPLLSWVYPNPTDLASAKTPTEGGTV